MSSRSLNALRLYPRQAEAWRYLTDAYTTDVVYGGAAGGAKTFLGCAWQIHNRLNYPGTRGLIGRAQLKRLRQTTLRTFFDVCEYLGLKPKLHYQYLAQEGLIKFCNGSEIWLRDLQAYPSDPDFTSLGSLEITDAFVDEAGELTEKAVRVLASRIRYRLDVAGLPAKMLMTCNPARGWLYQQYYKPSRAGQLPSHAAFIQALLSDNQNPDFVRQYQQQLLKLDPVTRQRLLAGDWEYADDALALFSEPALLALVMPDALVAVPKQDLWLTIDVARFGADATCIGLWHGLHLHTVCLVEKQDLATTALQVRQMMQSHGVPRNQVIIDTDGVGGGLADQLPGSRQFVAQHKAIPQKGKAQAYTHLKAQCYYRLAEAVQQAEISFSPKLAEQFHKGKSVMALLMEELLVVKRHPLPDAGSLAINKKEDMKALLGRSPDVADMVMMRMWPLLQPAKLIFS